MNKFLIKLAQLLLITIVLLAIIGIYKQQDHNYSSKKSLFEANKTQIVGLILGTSHSQYGINPTLFPFKAINIGERNKPIEVDIEIVEKNILQLPNLKYVIIPIDYFTFYYTGLNEPFSARYYHHWNLKQGYIKSYTFKRYHIFNCGFSLTEHDNNNDHALLGYLPQYDNLTSLTEDQKNAACKKRVDNWNRFWIDTSNTSFVFNRIIDLGTLLKRKKIQPIFVTFPMSTKLYNYCDSSILLRNTILINQIVTKTQAKYIDLEKNPAFKTDSLFSDVDHLNDKGAKVATGIIKDFLNH